MLQQLTSIFYCKSDNDNLLPMPTNGKNWVNTRVYLGDSKTYHCIALQYLVFPFMKYVFYLL